MGKVSVRKHKKPSTTHTVNYITKHMEIKKVTIHSQCTYIHSKQPREIKCKYLIVRLVLL